jgi:hypothetical protein
VGHFLSIVHCEQSDEAQVSKADLSKGTVDLYADAVAVTPRIKLEQRDKEPAGWKHNVALYWYFLTH